jgi:NAD(P)-dependent dehydrogenase (short-subunit alcohol dehydrogenase family)
MPLNILVTGSNSGFGLAIAEHAARAGHNVHATLRSLDRAGPLEQLRAAGLPIFISKLDVTDPESIASAVAEAAALRPIDVLVNNAGFEVVAPVEELTDDLLFSQFDTNVFGLVRMVRAVTPAMRELRQGCIINLSSVLGHVSLAHRGAYTASKHAVEAFSKTLWMEMRPFGVRVVTVVPGAFPTKFAANYVYAPGFDEDSPYRPYERALAGGMRDFIEQTMRQQSANYVADAVLRAAEHPAPPLHWLVGTDAESLVPALHAKSWEAFLADWFGSLGIDSLLSADPFSES